VHPAFGRGYFFKYLTRLRLHGAVEPAGIYQRQYILQIAVASVIMGVRVLMIMSMRAPVFVFMLIRVFQLMPVHICMLVFVRLILLMPVFMVMRAPVFVFMLMRMFLLMPVNIVVVYVHDYVRARDRVFIYFIDFNLIAVDADFGDFIQKPALIDAKV